MPTSARPSRSKKNILDSIPVAPADPETLKEVDDLINLGLAELRIMIRDGSADVKANAIKSLMPLINRKLDPKEKDENEDLKSMKVAHEDILKEIRAT